MPGPARLSTPHARHTVPKRSLLAAALLSVLLACQDGGADSITSAAHPAESAAIRASHAGDIPGLRQEAAAIAARLDAAWAAKDPEAYAANFALETRMIAPIGAILAGRTAVRNAHQGLFSGPFRNSVRNSTVADLLFLTGSSAIVELTVDLTEFSGTPPGLTPTTPTLLRTRERLVLERHDGEWLILRGQITVVTAGVAGL